MGMKKHLILGILSSLMVVGCANQNINLNDDTLATCSDANIISSIIDEGVNAVYKPVIYLYSDCDDKYVEVAINTEQDMNVTYPKMNDYWKVIANTDGTIYDLENKQYNYLYWEASAENINWDWSKGFCVEGEKSAEFLEKALEGIGLNRKEANEFIVYWLPQMEANNYNLITFQTDVYENEYELLTHPLADNTLRVMMVFKGLEEPVKIEEQDLNSVKGTFKREGFHIVEWGGSYIK